MSPIVRNLYLAAVLMAGIAGGVAVGERLAADVWRRGTSRYGRGQSIDGGAWVVAFSLKDCVSSLEALRAWNVPVGYPVDGVVLDTKLAAPELAKAVDGSGINFRIRVDRDGAIQRLLHANGYDDRETPIAIGFDSVGRVRTLLALNGRSVGEMRRLVATVVAESERRLPQGAP